MLSEFFADGFNDDVTGILVALLPEVSVDDDSAPALQLGAEVLLQERRLAGATTGAEKEAGPCRCKVVVQDVGRQLLGQRSAMEDGHGLLLQIDSTRLNEISTAALICRAAIGITSTHALRIDPNAL